MKFTYSAGLLRSNAKIKVHVSKSTNLKTNSKYSILIHLWQSKSKIFNIKHTSFDYLRMLLVVKWMLLSLHLYLAQSNSHGVRIRCLNTKINTEFEFIKYSNRCYEWTLYYSFDLSIFDFISHKKGLDRAQMLCYSLLPHNSYTCISIFMLFFSMVVNHQIKHKVQYKWPVKLVTADGYFTFGQEFGWIYMHLLSMGAAMNMEYVTTCSTSWH